MPPWTLKLYQNGKRVHTMLCSDAPPEVRRSYCVEALLRPFAGLDLLEACGIEIRVFRCVNLDHKRHMAQYTYARTETQ